MTAALGILIVINLTFGMNFVSIDDIFITFVVLEGYSHGRLGILWLLLSFTQFVLLIYFTLEKIDVLRKSFQIA